MVAGPMREDRVEAFVGHVAAAASEGGVALLDARGDYDRFEVFRRNGRVDTVEQLVSASAQVRVTFPVRFEALGEGQRLCFAHPGDRGSPGLWLTGKGAESTGPIDVIEACFHEVHTSSGPSRAHGAADLVLSELVFHDFTRDRAWREMAKRFHLRSRVYADSRGLWCDMLIDMEACG